MGFVRDYLTDVESLVAKLPEETIEKVVEHLVTAFENNKRLLLMGNGGSGATASHFANDFQKTILLVSGKPFRALSLVDGVPTMTAWANDTEYANIFEPQVQTWAEPGDLVVAISGSGNSENVLRAVRTANERGAVTIGLTGMGGGKLAGLAQISIVVDSHNMQMIEDVHTVILHCAFSAMRERVSSAKVAQS